MNMKNEGYLYLANRKLDCIPPDIEKACFSGVFISNNNLTYLPERFMVLRSKR